MFRLVSSLLLVLFTACLVHGYAFPMNVTVGKAFPFISVNTDTELYITFLTDGTSGVATFQDFSYSTYQYRNYTLPQGLKEYTLFGVYQVDMQNVKIPFNAKVSIKHDFTFGMLNVKPKDCSIVGIDVNTKEIKMVDFKSGDYYNEMVLPLQNSVYTFGVMGIVYETPAQFGVPTMVNYRSSLRYEVNKGLNQYLSTFINRPLTFPAHEYVARKVDNQTPIPFSNMVEILSFSFTPMFPNKKPYSIIFHDFEMTFDKNLGFVDKNGKRINIDPNTLQCIYIVPDQKGFVQVPSSSVVFPTLQKLSCTPGIGINDWIPNVQNFYPSQVTIIASLNDAPSPSPKDSVIIPKTTHFKPNVSNNEGTGRMANFFLLLVVAFYLFL